MLFNITSTPLNTANGNLYNITVVQPAYHPVTILTQFLGVTQ